MFSVVFRYFDSCSPQFKILLGDDYDYQNIDYLTKDLVVTIGQFESFTIISGADEDEDDEYIDNMSSCSSESMVSTVCQVIEDFDVDYGDAYYSTISLSEYQESNPDIVRQDKSSIKYIIEENKNSIYHN